MCEKAVSCEWYNSGRLMPGEHPRIAREKRTLSAMVRMYCRDRHGTGGDLCRDCREVLEYARCRLDKCPYQETKPTCAVCPIHCYEPGMKERVRAVMRHSGPRLMRRHPILALLHVLDGFRKPPKKKPGRK